MKFTRQNILSISESCSISPILMSAHLNDNGITTDEDFF
jgi:hypothetical protein